MIIKFVKLQSDPYSDIRCQLILMTVKHSMSVMPCHLNGDVHEWFNEVVTVPNQNLLNSLTGENAGVALWEAEAL